MKAKTVKIDAISVNPNNPRVIKDRKFEKLVNSLKDFPEMMSLRPIVVNKDQVIIGGNMRYQAAKAAGWKEVTVVEANLTPEQEREFILKDNASFGEWDWDMLANEWNDLPIQDWGLDVWQTDFEPNLNPNDDKSKITEADIAEAENNQEQKPTAAATVTTICPDCACEFEVAI